METFTCIIIAIFKNDFLLRYLEVVICFCMLIIVVYFKKNNSILIRENFIKNYKFLRYFAYCYDLINSMNGFQFSLKNNEILVLFMKSNYEVKFVD